MATETKNAVLLLQGATCTSCSIAIEHLGRRLDGVSDIYVDRGSGTIHVAYDGNQQILDRLIDFVDQLGYRATTESVG